jgi:hypothetical protein
MVSMLLSLSCHTIVGSPETQPCSALLCPAQLSSSAETKNCTLARRSSGCGVLKFWRLGGVISVARELAPPSAPPAPSLLSPTLALISDIMSCFDFDLVSSLLFYSSSSSRLTPPSPPSLSSFVSVSMVKSIKGVSMIQSSALFPSPLPRPSPSPPLLLLPPPRAGAGLLHSPRLPNNASPIPLMSSSRTIACSAADSETPSSPRIAPPAGPSPFTSTTRPLWTTPVNTTSHAERSSSWN